MIDSIDMNYRQAWFAKSLEYKKYGKYIILNNTGKYVKFYVIPNIRFVFYPCYGLLRNNYEMTCEDKKVISQWSNIPEVAFNR